MNVLLVIVRSLAGHKCLEVVCVPRGRCGWLATGELLHALNEIAGVAFPKGVRRGFVWSAALRIYVPATGTSESKPLNFAPHRHT
jgi:hypothetical protein